MFCFHRSITTFPTKVKITRKLCNLEEEGGGCRCCEMMTILEKCITPFMGGPLVVSMYLSLQHFISFWTGSRGASQWLHSRVLINTLPRSKWNILPKIHFSPKLFVIRDISVTSFMCLGHIAYAQQTTYMKRHTPLSRLSDIKVINHILFLKL